MKCGSDLQDFFFFGCLHFLMQGFKKSAKFGPFVFPFSGMLQIVGVKVVSVLVSHEVQVD